MGARDVAPDLPVVSNAGAAPLDPGINGRQARHAEQPENAPG
jgi:hypothetical protein